MGGAGCLRGGRHEGGASWIFWLAHAGLRDAVFFLWRRLARGNACPPSRMGWPIFLQERNAAAVGLLIALIRLRGAPSTGLRVCSGFAPALFFAGRGRRVPPDGCRPMDADPHNPRGLSHPAGQQAPPGSFYRKSIHEEPIRRVEGEWHDWTGDYRFCGVLHPVRGDGVLQ